MEEKKFLSNVEILELCLDFSSPDEIIEKIHDNNENLSNIMRLMDLSYVEAQAIFFLNVRAKQYENFPKMIPIPIRALKGLFRFTEYTFVPFLNTLIAFELVSIKKGAMVFVRSHVVGYDL